MASYLMLSLLRDIGWQLVFRLVWMGSMRRLQPRFRAVQVHRRHVGEFTGFRFDGGDRRVEGTTA